MPRDRVVRMRLPSPTLDHDVALSPQVPFRLRLGLLAPGQSADDEYMRARPSHHLGRSLSPSRSLRDPGGDPRSLEM